VPVTFKIKITKEILRLSKECGTHGSRETIGKNCAIAVSLKDLFPNVHVAEDEIYPFGIEHPDHPYKISIPMPKIARDFVQVFDSLSAMPKQRLLLPEFEFEIPIPEEIISQINIDSITGMDEEQLFSEVGSEMKLIPADLRE
jgi:hypothetical protein